MILDRHLIRAVQTIFDLINLFDVITMSDEMDTLPGPTQSLSESRPRQQSVHSGPTAAAAASSSKMSVAREPQLDRLPEVNVMHQ